MESYTEKRPLGLGLLAGVVAAVGVGAWAVRAEVRRAAVERVLAEDKALHDRVAAGATARDALWDGSGVIGRYVDGMRAIDRSGCPADFAAAFDAHAAAWAGYERAARRHAGLRGLFRDFFSARPVAAALDGDAEVRDAQALVRRTWEDVVRVARGHGAKGP